MLSRDAVLLALACHIGEAQGVRARDLVTEILGETSSGAERQLRHVIEELRLEGEHICGHPSTGYFMAMTDAELERTTQFLRDRAGPASGQRHAQGLSAGPGRPTEVADVNDIDTEIAMRLRDLALRDWVRSCLRKRRYAAERDAYRVGSKRSRPGARARAPALFAYYCRHCGGWHLTRRLHEDKAA